MATGMKIASETCRLKELSYGNPRNCNRSFAGEVGAKLPFSSEPFLTSTVSSWCFIAMLIVASILSPAF